MKKGLLVGLLITASIGGFLTYRYYIHGKGNKGLINPTTFGW